jgi:hypothetical protein
MNYKILFASILFIASFSSCKKDLASDWEGTYDGVAGNNTINRVAVTKVNNNTIKMELQTQVFGTYLTYATIANAKLSSSSVVSINEDGTVAGNSCIYHFTGSGTRNGNTLQLNG